MLPRVTIIESEISDQESGMEYSLMLLGFIVFVLNVTSPIPRYILVITNYEQRREGLMCQDLDSRKVHGF